MTTLTDGKRPEPGIPAIIAGACLFFVGGVWFIVKAIGILALLVTGQEVEGTVKSYYPSRLGIEIVVVTNPDGSLHETTAVVSPVLGKGDQVAVLLNAHSQFAYLRDIALPNGIIYLSLGLALVVCGFIFAKRLRLLERIKKNAEPVEFDPR